MYMSIYIYIYTHIYIYIYTPKGRQDRVRGQQAEGAAGEGHAAHREIIKLKIICI